MEFIPQFFNNSRTLLVMGFMAWGIAAYGLSRGAKRLQAVKNGRSRA